MSRYSVRCFPHDGWLVLDNRRGREPVGEGFETEQEARDAADEYERMDRGVAYWQRREEFREYQFDPQRDV